MKAKSSFAFLPLGGPSQRRILLQVKYLDSPKAVNLKNPMDRNERKYLPELIKLFEHPEVTSAKYLKASYISFAFGAVLLFGAALLGALKLWLDLKEMFLILAGCSISSGVFFRLSAKQIPVLAKYAEFKLTDARDAVEKGNGGTRASAD